MKVRRDSRAKIDIIEVIAIGRFLRHFTCSTVLKMGAQLYLRVLFVYFVLTSGLPDENASTSTGKTVVQHTGGGEDSNASVDICRMRY